MNPFTQLKQAIRDFLKIKPRPDAYVFVQESAWGNSIEYFNYDDYVKSGFKTPLRLMGFKDGIKNPKPRIGDIFQS